MSEQIEEKKQRFVRDGLFISRVPKETKKQFLDLANSDEFMSDYGFTLKYTLEQCNEYQEFKKFLFFSFPELIKLKNGKKNNKKD